MRGPQISVNVLIFQPSIVLAVGNVAAALGKTIVIIKKIVSFSYYLLECVYKVFLHQTCCYGQCYRRYYSSITICFKHKFNFTGMSCNKVVILSQMRIKAQHILNNTKYQILLFISENILIQIQTSVVRLDYLEYKIYDWVAGPVNHGWSKLQRVAVSCPRALMRSRIWLACQLDQQLLCSATPAEHGPSNPRQSSTEWPLLPEVVSETETLPYHFTHGSLDPVYSAKL